jgi:hypothetical protein
MKKKTRRFLSLLLVCMALFTVLGSTSSLGAWVAGEFSEQVNYLSENSAQFQFDSLCSSTYVYVHYMVNSGQDMHYSMSQNDQQWTYTMNNLSEGDIIEYWYTYQIGATQKDTPNWEYIYTHTDAPISVQTPVFTPVSGTYAPGQSISISCATIGATIYYTTDGTDPDDGSAVYNAPIVLGSSATIKAVAYLAGQDPSAIASGSFVITPVTAAPVIAPAGGSFDSPVTVTISCSDGSAAIYYTLDGSTPTTASAVYTSGFQLSATTTVKAMAHKANSLPSQTVSQTYRFGTQPHDPGMAKFEPEDGNCLVVIGQCKEDMYDYANIQGLQAPAGYMFYTACLDAAGMALSSNKGAGTIDFPYWYQNYDNTIAQIGIDMTDYDGHDPGADEEVNVAAGLRDDNIRIIANAVKASGKPTYVRIGYEADSPWNHYESWNYIKAYRRVHDIFREEEVANAAFVWSLVGTANAAGPAPYHESMAIETWYPGDGYVDWVSVSIFGWETYQEEQNAENARIKAAEFAQAHGKPLMIGEATPRTYYPMNQQSTWNNYFAKLFNYIEEYDVKMLCYINQNWANQPIFSDPMWGDSRLQQPGASYILDLWKAKMQEPRYIGSSTSLYDLIGFDSNAGCLPPVSRECKEIPVRISASDWDDAFLVFAAPSADPLADPDGISLCWLSDESWTEYGIESSSSRSVTVSLRIANGGSATSATVKLDGSAAATITIPATGDWANYQTVSATITVPQGEHILRIECGGTFNFDWVEIQ